jgi:hypothetical protein
MPLLKFSFWLSFIAFMCFSSSLRLSLSRMSFPLARYHAALPACALWYQYSLVVAGDSDAWITGHAMGTVFITIVWDPKLLGPDDLGPGLCMGPRTWRWRMRSTQDLEVVDVKHPLCLQLGCGEGPPPSPQPSWLLGQCDMGPKVILMMMIWCSTEAKAGSQSLLSQRPCFQ